MEKTKQQLGLYFEAIQVPNWKERLDKKSPEFIFDLGVYIATPLLDDETVTMVREIMDDLLNYDSFYEANISIEKKIKQRVFTSGLLQLFAIGRGVKKDVEAEENELKVKYDIAKALSKSEKIAHLLNVCDKLGKKNKSEYYDRLDDLEHFNKDYFNMCYVVLLDNMQDNHYKECECVGRVFDAFVFSDSEKEARKKLE